MDQAQQGAIVDPNTGSVTNVNSLALQTALDNARLNLVNQIQNNFMDKTPRDVFGGREIIKQEFSILPPSISSRIVVLGTKLSEIADSMRHKSEQ